MNSRYGFDQDFLAFAVKFGREDANARRIAIWPGQRVHKSRPDHILCKREDRNRFCRLLCGANSCVPVGHDNVDLGFHQFGGIFRTQIGALRKIATRDREVLTFNEFDGAGFCQKKRYLGACLCREMGIGYPSDKSAPFLRRRSERPCGNRATYKREKLAPPHRSLPQTDRV